MVMMAPCAFLSGSKHYCSSQTDDVEEHVQPLWFRDMCTQRLPCIEDIDTHSSTTHGALASRGGGGRQKDAGSRAPWYTGICQLYVPRRQPPEPIPTTKKFLTAIHRYSGRAENVLSYSGGRRKNVCDSAACNAMRCTKVLA